MFNTVKHFSRHLTTIKKIKPTINNQKHKYDIENESWFEPKNQDTFYIYKVIKIEKKEILIDKKPKKEK
jgi:hypothetical protein